MDGARLFNASVATGIDVADYAARADLVMTCLSKGLGAPVGSVLAGRADDMERARLERKRLGGSMRQAGRAGGAGLLAVRENVERLADDHARARRLAEAVAERWPGALDPSRGAHQHRGGAAGPRPQGGRPPGRPRACWPPCSARPALRFVTHLDVDDAGVDRACRACRRRP